MLKKIFKIIAVVIIIITFLFLIIAGYFGFKLKDYKAAESSQITPELMVLKGKRVNMYIVRSGSDIIAIDGADDSNIILSNLQNLNIDPLAVKAVFLTHSDADHTAAAPLFKNAVIYISDQEEQMIDGSRERKMLFFRSFNKLPSSEYQTLADNEITSIGNMKIKGILTPGHTPGSMSFLIDNKYLLIGDIMLIKNNSTIPMGKPFTEDIKQNDSSVKKLLKAYSNIEVIGTAHTGYLIKK